MFRAKSGRSLQRRALAPSAFAGGRLSLPGQVQPAEGSRLGQLPGYSNITEIATGTFATVYRATELGTDRPVALKVLRVADTSRRMMEVFDQELGALSLLSNHPNVTTLYRTFLTPEGRPVLVLELCKGSLAQRARQSGPLPPSEVVRAGVKIAGALETAHRCGLLHRDMKPQNILVSEFDEPVLADFGVAALQVAAQSTEGIFGFTTLHAPPEALEGHPLSPSADIYGLASSMYQLLVGHGPFAAFDGEAPASVILRILRDPAPRAPAAGMPIALADLLQDALAKDPARRPQNAIQFADALREVEAAAGWPLTPYVVWGTAPGDAAPPAAAPVAVSTPGGAVSTPGGAMSTPGGGATAITDITESSKGDRKNATSGGSGDETAVETSESELRKTTLGGFGAAGGLPPLGPTPPAEIRHPTVGPILPRLPPPPVGPTKPGPPGSTADESGPMAGPSRPTVNESHLTADERGPTVGPSPAGDPHGLVVPSSTAATLPRPQPVGPPRPPVVPLGGGRNVVDPTQTAPPPAATPAAPRLLGASCATPASTTPASTGATATAAPRATRPAASDDFARPVYSDPYEELRGLTPSASWATWPLQQPSATAALAPAHDLRSADGPGALSRTAHGIAQTVGAAGNWRRWAVATFVAAAVGILIGLAIATFFLHT